VGKGGGLKIKNKSVRSGRSESKGKEKSPFWRRKRGGESGEHVEATGRERKGREGVHDGIIWRTSSQSRERPVKTPATRPTGCK